jgi:hypothetical protein
MANKCPIQDKINGETIKNKNKLTFKKCLNCNMKRHLARYCWFQESNKDKRPPGFKIKDNKTNCEEVAATINSSNNNNNNLQECLLGTTDNEDILNDSDFWIADTAMTVHMTSNCQ